MVHTLKPYIVVNLAVIAGLGGRLILILGTDHAHFFRKFAGEHLYGTPMSSLAYLYPPPRQSVLLLDPHGPLPTWEAARGSSHTLLIDCSTHRTAHTMADTTAKKIDSSHSPTGPQGQQYLAAGKRLSMRLWEEEPGDAADDPPHARPYETIGYVIEGRAELHLESQKLLLEPGDSWTVPSDAEHSYTILEDFKAVEATAPPARARARDEDVG